jgi:hypothetical protein
MEVSALITTYNRRSFIFRAIESVLAQTVPVDEIIVVDDGSTDGTADEIAVRYGSRITVIRQPNSGVGVARKTAIDHAKGQWIAFLDSDDEWLPDRNETLLKAASMVPDRVGWIFGDCEFVWNNGHQDTIFGEQALSVRDFPHIFTKPLTELMFDPKDLTGELSRPRACVLEASLLRSSALAELECFSEGLRHAEDFLASMQFATRYWFAAVPAAVTRAYRTSELDGSSLARSCWTSSDHYRGAVLAYALAARVAGRKPWGFLHAQAVRATCRYRASMKLPIRRLALDQFKFDCSARSVFFFGTTLPGSRFYSAAASLKRKFKTIRRRKHLSWAGA